MQGESWFARVAAIGAALSVAVAGLYRGSNPDTLGHLAQGRQILRLGHVPQVDTWSLLPGPPRDWHNYEWLSDLATYALYENLGDASVTLAKCSLLLIAVLCLARVAGLLAGPRAVVLASLAMVSTIPAIRARLSDRPHVIGICLAAAYLLLFTMLSQTASRRRSSIQRAPDDTAPFTKADRRRCVVIVGTLFVLHLLWVNAHGSHLLGLCMTGSFLVLGSRQARRWFAAVLGLQLIAACVSPYGPAISIDAIAHLTDPRYRNLVSEWQTWQPHDPVWLQLGPALHGAFLAVLAPSVLRSSPEARAALPIALVLGIACFRSIRFLAEFMLLTSPLIGVGMAALGARLRTRTFALASFAAVIVLAGMVPWATAQLPPSMGIGMGVGFVETPRAAGRLLAKHGTSPRVFASMQDSWATMFSAPNCRFVLDGRVPFYGPEHVARASRAFDDRAEFDSLVRELGVNVVIAAFAAQGEQRVGSFVLGRPDYSLVQLEDLHATFVRAGALDEAGTREHPRLVALEPSYDMGWILSADAARRTAIEGELARLARDPGTSGYRSWVEGVVALSTLRRGGPSDGFRWPRDDLDWRVYERARPLIVEASAHAPHVPVVAALRASISAVFCDFADAQRAVARAMSDEPSREALLASQEILLRQGKQAEVRALVSAARALPQGREDPWLAELARGVDAVPACPP